MCKMSKAVCLTALLTTIFLAGTIKAETGVKVNVRSTSGNPIAKAWVFCRGKHLTETDENGEFTLDSSCKVLFLRHDKYKPIVRILNQPPATLEITMEPSQKSEITIPACEQSPNQIEFARYKITVPQDAELKEFDDVDFVAFSLKYSVGRVVHRLEGWVGPHATSGFPDDKLILNSAEFSVVPWRSTNYKLLDFRGRKVDGTLWRYVGTYGFCFTYEDTTLAAASFFDKVIDSTCLAY